MTQFLSVIIPMFNEENLVDQVLQVIGEQVSSTGMQYEMICIDDGSTDKTDDRIDEFAASNEHVVAIHFSRNFGKEAALSAGLAAAKGDAVILLDADLQHPPSLIPKFVEYWNEGYDIVEGTKKNRGKENSFYRFFAKLFYLLIGSELGNNMRRSSDYKLLDRQVVDTINSLPEKSRFFRGLVAWVGFKHKAVEFDVQERIAGDTAWSLTGLIKYAFNNILAFTTAPLYSIAWIGLITSLFGMALGIHTLYNYLSGKAATGFTTTILLLIIFAGIILLSIGTVAIYLAKVIEEVKNRPVYIIRRKPEKRGQKNSGSDKRDKSMDQLKL